MSGLVVDLFAGGGGVSTGIEAALGRPVDLAINHSPVAIAVHAANHCRTRHLTSDVFEVDPIHATRGEPVEFLWASPDCTHFSRAKGSRPDRPRSRKIRSLAWVVVRWARAVRPRVIALENVEEFQTWGPLDRSGQPIAEVALIDMQRENAPRALDRPLGTLTTQGNRFNLLRAAFVARHFGGMVGDPADKPIATITARDHHGPVAAALVKFRGECNGADLDEPMPTITAQGMHLAECRAFLTKYYGSRQTKGACLFDPAPTATSKARFGLVIVDGVEYEIGDIYLRMLEPHELLRAQFGEFADSYDLSAARTKEAKTRLVGNSVCPHVAAAIVRANLEEYAITQAVGA